MTGKRLTSKLRLMLFLVGMLLPGQACAQGAVAVLLSDTLEVYKEPVATFIEEVGVPAKRYELRGDLGRASQIRQEVMAENPAMILAVGAKAACLAKVWTHDRQEIPVLFIMVINWQQYGLIGGQENIAGIGMEVAPGTQLANMAVFTPQTRRIGVIYSKDFAPMFREAQQSAGLIGLEIVGVEINTPNDFRRAFKELTPKVDGFWMLNDPTAFTLENVEWFRERCISERLVCIGQAEEMTRAGVLLSIGSDSQTIGTQAASVALNILNRRQNPKKIGVMPPLSTRVSINLETATKIGLPIGTLPLEMAARVYN